MRVWWGSAAVLPHLVSITLKKKCSLVTESVQNSLSGLWPPPANMFPVRLGSAILSLLPSAVIFHRGMTARFYGTMEACQAKTGSDIFLAGNKWAKAKNSVLWRKTGQQSYILKKSLKKIKTNKEFVKNLFPCEYLLNFLPTRLQMINN